MKLARNSRGGDYQCQNEWPEDCFVQCGGNGIVITYHKIEDVLTDPEKAAEAFIGATSGNEATQKLPFYRTAFFEAFPRNPNTFIRGEGKTVEEAENECWKTYQAYFECDHPSFEPRDYENGSGFCTKCGLWFSGVIKPIHPCQVCGKLTWDTKDKDGDFWCEDHYRQMPVEKMTETQKKFRKMLEEDEAENL